ncbi:MAG: methionyl-tRNA formyltransferase [Candidatus Paceibacterota bacterium]
MMDNPRFVFFGTPDMGVYVLEELEKRGFLPSLVVTAPDRPQGRGMVLQAPPVKEWAQSHNIPVFQPERLDTSAVEKLEEMRPWDLFVVAAYGKIIPQPVIDIPRRGILNVHPSLLPRFRGASPIQSQILEDEQDVGVTIMLIDEKLDHGPIVAQSRVEIPEWPPKASELEEILAREGGKILAESIPGWLPGAIEAQKQDHEKATLTKKISKEDGEIDLSDDPYTNYLKIQAFDVWPRTYFFHGEEKMRVIITEAEYTDGKLEIKKVIPAGKAEMTYDEFIRGFGN